MPKASDAASQPNRAAHALKMIAAGLLAPVAWFAVATLGNIALRAALPGYAAAEPGMDFTLPMLIARLLIGALASMVTGLAIALVFRKTYLAPLVAGAVLVALFIPVHVTLWSRFPVWYHVVFLGSLLVLTSMPALWARSAGRVH